MVKSLLLVSIAAAFVMGCMFSDSRMSGGIWDAILADDLQFIDNYAKNGGDLEAGRKYQGTPLFFAMKHRKKKAYLRLLSLGASPNTVCDNGVVVMHYAAGDEDSFWLYEALKSKGDPNLFNWALHKGPHAGQPLMYAIMEDRFENAKLLVDHGADINTNTDMVDHQGKGTWKSPLVFGVEMNRFDICLLLLQGGVDFTSAPYKELSFIWKMRNKIGTYMPAKEKASLEAIQQWFSGRGMDVTRAEWINGKWHFPDAK